MWDAIEVGSGCTYTLTDTEIRNATRGLVLLPGNESSYIFHPNICKIQGCTFRDNRIGITVDYGVGTGSKLFLPSVFANNTFTSNGLHLLQPIQAQFPEAAMVFNSCGLAVLPATNAYEMTRYGITSNLSLVVLYDGVFKNITEDAVLADSSTLHVQKTAFENVGKMVTSTHGRNLVVKNCNLKQGRKGGIYVDNTNTFQPRVLISVNNLSFEKVPTYAISVERSPSTDLNMMKNQIDHDTITVHGEHTVNSKLISITAPNGGEDKFPIRSNKITVDATLGAKNCHGIFITNNASGYEVWENKLYYNSTNPINNVQPANTVLSPNLGITFENVNGLRNYITLNEVYSTLFPNPWDEEAVSWMKCCYHFDQATNLQICYNKGNHTYRCFHFSGNLSYCDFARNTINEHYYGLHCAKQPGSPNTDMGPQSWHENKWLTTPNSYQYFSAQHRDFLGGNTPFKFRVYPSEPEQNPPGALLSPPKVTPFFWFLSVNPTPNDKENSKCVGETFEADDTLGTWDRNVIDGTYPYASAAQAWDMQRDLLAKLIARGFVA